MAYVVECQRLKLSPLFLPLRSKNIAGHPLDHVHLSTLNRVFLQGHSKSAARLLDDLLLSFIVKMFCLWAYYMLQYSKIMLA